MKTRLTIGTPLILISLLGCGVIERLAEPRYYALSISSTESIFIYNLNRHGESFPSWTESEGLTAIMAEAGDLLYIEISDLYLLYRYDPQDGQHLSFTSDPDAPYKTFLNDQLINLEISEDPEVWQWLEECDVSSLRRLRSLTFYEFENGSLNLSLLRKIADVRPNIGLFLDVSDIDEIIKLFTPSWLYCYSEDLDEEIMPRLKKLECLFADLSGDARFIEELPRLDNLILFNDEALDIQFDRINKLRSLTLIEWDDISSLETFSIRNRLRNLYLVNCYVEDSSPIYAFPQLTGLGLLGCEDDINVVDLQNMSSLRWFSFPPGVTQNDFSTFLSQHPDLKVVDLIVCDEIENLSPLAGLEEIQGLNLYVDVEDFSPLYQLTGLEVLVHTDLFDEEEYQNLQAALPDTQIAIGGFCLGSGWILLVIPFVMVVSLAFHRGRRRFGK